MKVSVVIPTKNEELNILRLLSQVMKYADEVIVVDDSSDMTAKLATGTGAIVVNGQRKGLGQAIIDGISHASNEVVLVMDADFSHSPQSIPHLLNPIIEHGYDMCVGSRYVKGGDTLGWTKKRIAISRFAGSLAYLITGLRDNTSGFFAFRRSIVQNTVLKPESWKIMLEVLIKCSPVSVKEVPISFTDRCVGESKFNMKQVAYYLKHLLKLGLYKYQKFVKFCIVGASGALITFVITWILTEVANWWYMASMVIAVIIATISNFTFNYLWTFGVQKSQKSPDYEWNSYYKGSLIQRWWKRQIAETVWKWIPESDKLLDIGCGSSPIVSHYTRQATAIDLIQDKIKFMKWKFPTVAFFATDIGNIVDTYDNVICIEVLEHLHEAEKMVANISRCLKKGGTAVIATPDYSKPLWHLAEKFTPYEEEHVTHFNRESLETLCGKYNLIPKKYRYVFTCDLIEMFEKIG